MTDLVHIQMRRAMKGSCGKHTSAPCWCWGKRRRRGRRAGSAAGCPRSQSWGSGQTDRARPTGSEAWEWPLPRQVPSIWRWSVWANKDEKMTNRDNVDSCSRNRRQQKFTIKLHFFTVGMTIWLFDEIWSYLSKICIRSTESHCFKEFLYSSIQFPVHRMPSFARWEIGYRSVIGYVTIYTNLTFFESCKLISPVVLLWPSKSDPGVVVPGGGEATVMDPLRVREPLAERRRDPVLSAPGLSLSLPFLPVGVANSSCVMDKN